VAVDNFGAPMERFEFVLVRFEVVTECRGLALPEAIHIDDRDQIVEAVDARE
jgi:hypothetical protein